MEGKSDDISKNAQKKALKAEKKAQKEAEKLAKKAEAPTAGSHPKLGGDDDDLDPTQYYENRLKYITSAEVISRYVKIRC
jgi:lysyl-tRNA synthetase class 2